MDQIFLPFFVIDEPKFKQNYRFWEIFHINYTKIY